MPPGLAAPGPAAAAAAPTAAVGTGAQVVRPPGGFRFASTAAEVEALLGPRVMGIMVQRQKENTIAAAAAAHVPPSLPRSLLEAATPEALVAAARRDLPPAVWHNWLAASEDNVARHVMGCTADPCNALPTGLCARLRAVVSRTAAAAPPAAAATAAVAAAPPLPPTPVTKEHITRLSQLLHAAIVRETKAPAEGCPHCPLPPRHCANLRRHYDHILACAAPAYDGAPPCPVGGAECNLSKMLWHHLHTHWSQNMVPRCDLCSTSLRSATDKDKTLVSTALQAVPHGKLQLEVFVRGDRAPPALAMPPPRPYVSVSGGVGTVAGVATGSEVGGVRPPKGELVGGGVAAELVEVARRPLPRNVAAAARGAYAHTGVHLHVLADAGLDAVGDGLAASLTRVDGTSRLAPYGAPAAGELARAVRVELEAKDRGRRSVASLAMAGEVGARRSEAVTAAAEAEVALLVGARSLLAGYARFRGGGGGGGGGSGRGGAPPLPAEGEFRVAHGTDLAVFDALFARARSTVADVATLHAAVPLPWQDVGVCGPSGAGLLRRMRVAALRAGAVLTDADPAAARGVDLTAAASVAAASPPPRELLAAFNRRLPDLRDLLDVRAASRLAAATLAPTASAAERADTDAFVARTYGGAVGDEEAAAAAAASRVLVPTTSPPSSASAPAPAAPYSAVSLLADASTAFTLTLLSHLLLAARNGQRSRATALLQLARVGVPGADAAPAAGAPTPAAAATATVTATAALQRDGITQPAEVVEAGEAVAGALWGRVVTAWKAWYVATKEELLEHAQRAGGVEGARKGGEARPMVVATLRNPLTDFMARTGGAAPGRLPPASMEAAYLEGLEGASHRHCRSAFVPPLEQLAEYYTSRAPPVTQAPPFVSAISAAFTRPPPPPGDAAREASSCIALAAHPASSDGAPLVSVAAPLAAAVAAASTRAVTLDVPHVAALIDALASRPTALPADTPSDRARADLAGAVFGERRLAAAAAAAAAAPAPTPGAEPAATAGMKRSRENGASAAGDGLGVAGAPPAKRERSASTASNSSSSSSDSGGGGGGGGGGGDDSSSSSSSSGSSDGDGVPSTARGPAPATLAVSDLWKVVAALRLNATPLPLHPQVQGLLQWAKARALYRRLQQQQLAQSTVSLAPAK